MCNRINSRMNTKILQRGSLSLIVILVAAINIFRFYGLDKAPPGFHVDELSMAVTIQCLAQEGIDASDRPYPLFGEVHYGTPKAPTYMYLGVLWTKIFGNSFAAYRSIAGFVTVIALIGLFFLGKILLGTRAALISVLAGSLSPLVFQVSRINMEACMAPCLMIWGMYFLFKSHKLRDAVLSGILLSLAMYSYPPTRLHVPLVMVFCVFSKTRKEGFNLRFWSALFLALVMTSAPLAWTMLNGEGTERFARIGIFSDEYFAAIGTQKTVFNVTKIFLKNYLLHLSPSFLFLKGSENLVYSTRFSGVMSWLDIFVLSCGILWLAVQWFKKNKSEENSAQKQWPLMALLAGGILTAIIPSALTWQDIPHALRILGTWPFLSLLAGYTADRIANTAAVFTLVLFVVAGIFSVKFYAHYSKTYAKDAYWMFNTWTKDEALKLTSKEEWLRFIVAYRYQNFHLRYYLMNYREGQACSSSQWIWKRIFQLDVKDPAALVDALQEIYGKL